MSAVLEEQKVLTPEEVRRLLSPSWCNIVIRRPEPPKDIGGILLPDKTRDDEARAELCGEIMALGPDCFTGAKFTGPEGSPRPKVGDWVLIRQYTGTRVWLAKDGREYVSIDDTAVVSVLPEGPQALAKVWK